VEAELEGDAGGVDALAEWCRRGPANAIVESVDILPGTETTEFTSFEVLY
jgi:acylphosphatase